jgi:hypothetical protein
MRLLPKPLTTMTLISKGKGHVRVVSFPTSQTRANDMKTRSTTFSFIKAGIQLVVRRWEARG